MQQKKWNDNWFFYKFGEEEEKKEIQLPYDAMIYEKRNPRCINSYNTGFYPGGKYVYERPFSMKEGTHAVVEFEGVYGITEVYLNEKRLAENVYGYTDFYVPLDDAYIPGKENRLIVKVDNSIEDTSRWYSGSGIYRDVNLFTSGNLFVQPGSFRIHTDEITDTAEIYAEATIENREEECKYVQVIFTVFFQDKMVLEHSESLEVETAATTHFHLKADIPSPKLWSAETPNLYQASIQLADVDGKELDEDHTRFGIRTLKWDSYQGFLVNGVPTKLRGGCVHHDNGMLGANTDYWTERRKVKKLKEIGFNAIRSAHNPIGKTLLDACDELGMYVMDETFDIWYAPKGENYFDYSYFFNNWWKKDTQAMVIKDYNHPSVIMYSIGNEIFETAFPKGIQLAEEMRTFIRNIDPWRPVTCSVNLFMNGTAKEKDEKDISQMSPRTGERNYEEEYTSSKEFNVLMYNMKKMVEEQVTQPFIDAATEGVFSKMDISGYNYGVERYGLDKVLHPERVIVGSETVSGDIDINWKATMENSNVIGDFIWTAYDHLGEAGIGIMDYEDKSYYKHYPFRTSGAGIIGINGNLSPLAYYTQIVYGIRKAPYIVAEPFDHPGETPSSSSYKFTNGIHSWDWAGCEGNTSRVLVFSDADSVALYLNGTCLGQKKVGKRPFTDFEIAYQPGILEAKAFDEIGNCIGTDCMRTPNGSQCLSVRPEESDKKRGKLLYIPISLVDENGILYHCSDKKIRINVEGADLVALGTEAPSSEEDFHGTETKLYQGCAMAIIRVENIEQNIKIIVSCDGCEETQLIL